MHCHRLVAEGRDGPGGHHLLVVHGGTVGLAKGFLPGDFDDACVLTKKDPLVALVDLWFGLGL